MPFYTSLPLNITQCIHYRAVSLVNKSPAAHLYLDASPSHCRITNILTGFINNFMHHAISRNMNTVLHMSCYDMILRVYLLLYTDCYINFY